KDVKIAMICSPHNPVGRVWKKEELEVFGNLCLKNNIIMISDEIHCDLTFSDYKHIPLASISDEFANNTITFMAPSKTFNIAGLFASVAIIPNEKLRKLYNDTIENMEITHTNGFSIIGFEAAYKYGKNWLSQAIRYIEDNADFAVDYINKNIPEIKTYKPEGTFLMWLDFKSLGKTSEEINELLINKGKVQLNNGATFGTAGEGFFRLNIGCPREVLKEGLDRIKKAIQ
ncbi:MAG TPA: cystathionine beta-lyase, partial [Tissierella sp.]